MSPKNLFGFDLSFIGLMISVIVCSILIFGFMKVLIYNYNSSRILGSRGNIQAGEYISVNKSLIYWGVLSPAENKTEEILVTNQAPVKMELQLQTADWNPANASEYLTLSWNYTGSLVVAKSSIPLALTLHVDPLISGIGIFSFNIINRWSAKTMKLSAIVRQALSSFKREALSRRNLRYFLYYAAANFLILILYTVYERSQPVNLDLQPVTSPATEGSFLLFVAAVILMPFSLLFEEFAFRLMPMVFIRDIFHLNSITISMEHEGKVTVVHNSPLRLWLHHHWLWIYIVVSAVWAGLLHQINIIESSPLGALIYFAIQAFSGCCFAYLYSRHGLGSSWCVHVLWDLSLVGLNLIVIL
jgi:hypothetical protein